jgi:putative peptidoglycan lipid II flippase
MAVFLIWASQVVPWMSLKGQELRRAGLFAACFAGAVAVYFAALWAAGLKLKALLKH